VRFAEVDRGGDELGHEESNEYQQSRSGRQQRRSNPDGQQRRHEAEDRWIGDMVSDIS